MPMRGETRRINHVRNVCNLQRRREAMQKILENMEVSLRNLGMLVKGQFEKVASDKEEYEGDETNRD